MKKSIWHPLKNMNVQARLIYNKDKEVIEIRYTDGYIVKEPSYIEDILFDSGVISEKQNSWIC